MPSRARSQKKEKKYSLPYLFPLIAVLAIIPEVVHLYVYDTGLGKYEWYQGPTSGVWDFFLHAKMILLYVTCAFMVFIMLYMVLSEEIKLIWDRQLIPVLIYGGVCVVSALASVDRHYSFFGIYSQFEPVWILLGYILILYYAFFHLNTESAVRRIMPWFIAGMVVVSIIGLAQASNHDLLKYKSFQQFVISDPSLIGHVAFNFEPGRVYASFFNPNYVGFYVVLTIPVILALLMHTKRWDFRLGYGILAVIHLYLLYASQSRAGILVLCVTFFIMLLCMRSVFFKNWKLTITIIAVAVAAFIGMNVVNNNVLLDRVKSMFDMQKETYALERIETDQDVAITYQGNTLHVTVTPDQEENLQFHFKDQDGKEVEHTPGTDGVLGTIDDSRFPFSFQQVRNEWLTGFQIDIPKTEIVDGQEQTTQRSWFFTNEMNGSDKSYYVQGYGSALFKMKKQTKGPKFLEDRYHLANMRGYIWAKTVPLLKKYFFLGSGPDTFVIAFPNDDLVGLWNSGHDKETVTKPHCMYLQIGVQTGVPSLIAFLVYFIWYIISSLRLYWRQSYDSYLSKLGLAALISVMGYLIVGLTNDSCVAVAPVFFAIAGMGLGINYRLKREK